MCQQHTNLCKRKEEYEEWNIRPWQFVSSCWVLCRTACGRQTKTPHNKHIPRPEIYLTYRNWNTLALLWQQSSLNNVTQKMQIMQKPNSQNLDDEKKSKLLLILVIIQIIQIAQFIIQIPPGWIPRTCPLGNCHLTGGEPDWFLGMNIPRGGGLLTEKKVTIRPSLHAQAFACRVDFSCVQSALLVQGKFWPKHLFRRKKMGMGGGGE